MKYEEMQVFIAKCYEGCDSLPELYSSDRVSNAMSLLPAAYSQIEAMLHLEHTDKGLVETVLDLLNYLGRYYLLRAHAGGVQTALNVDAISKLTPWLQAKIMRELEQQSADLRREIAMCETGLTAARSLLFKWVKEYESSGQFKPMMYVKAAT